jgi:hypothetical protein
MSSSFGPYCTTRSCSSDSDCDCGVCSGESSSAYCQPRLSICIHTNGGAQGSAGGAMGGGGVTGAGGGIDAGTGHVDGG